MSDPQISDGGPDGGQVLYNLAMGAQPEDFPPALQPLAQGYGALFQAQPAQAPGLLGSPDEIRQAITPAAAASAPAASDDDEDSDQDDDQDDDGQADDDQGDDDEDVSGDVGPAAAQPTVRTSGTLYPKTLDPTVERHVADYNRARGLKPGDMEYLDPDLIKAMIRQEAGHNYDALIHDPMQVNNTGDWADGKAQLGLSKGVAPGADLSVKAGIQWLRQKAYRHDSQGAEARFRGWPQAVQRYNGRLPDYSEQVWDHLGEIKGGF